MAEQIMFVSPMSPLPSPQVGIDYKYKFIEIDGKKVRLEVWHVSAAYDNSIAIIWKFHCSN